MDRHMSEFQRFVQKRKKCQWSGSESRWNCQMGGHMESGVARVGRQIGGWARDGTQVRRWVVIGIMRLWCRQDKNSVSSLPLEPCFDIPNNSLKHLLNSLFLWLEKLTKKSSNQTTYLFSCQTSL